MIDIYNRSERKKVAVLENAFKISETTSLNAVSELTFSLPASDDKASFCEPFQYVQVQGENNLYRLMSSGKTYGTDKDVLNFKAEHVLATLLDIVIPRTLQLDNLPTRTVLEKILSLQSEKNWLLGDCDFQRYFSYTWTSENLAAALFSVPKCFDEKYIWEYDTSSYPWKIHLRRLNENQNPQYYIREGKNLLSVNQEDDSTSMCTRLYCYGFGEGVNQLTFASINGGKEYVDASPEAIAKYGLIEKVWTDRRFEYAETLLARGKVLIDSLSKPAVSYQVDVADIEKLTNEEMDTPKVGKIVVVNGFKTYIVEVTRFIDEVGKETVIISNDPQDTAGTIADLADRQRINEVYAQGNTFLYPINFADNADPTHPAKFKFYIPSEARNVNTAVLTWDIEPFRAYETGASSGGGSSQTSSSGGGSVQTSSSGGGSSTTSSSGGGGSSTSSSGGATTSSSGGGSVQTSSVAGQASVTSSSGGYQSTTSGASSTKSASGLYVGGTGPSGEDLSRPRMLTTTNVNGHSHQYDVNHTHGIEHTHSITVNSHTHSVTTPAHQHDISIPAHTHSIGSHTHDVNIPSHSHNVSTPNHTHSTTIPEHNHTINIPSHTHAIIYGIYEGGRANYVSLRVDGQNVPISGNEINIVNYLKLDGGGKIQRGAFHTIEIIPDTMTRINASLAVQMFIQSEGGGVY